MKNKRINVRVSEADKKDLETIAEQIDVPEAIIVREAVREKIKKIKLGETVLSNGEVEVPA